jgi:hypothetical protein
MPPMVASLAAMGQVLANVGLNAHGIEVCYPGPLWAKLQDELKVEDQLRKIDAPLTLNITAPGLLTPMSITMRKLDGGGSLILTA